MLGPTEAISWGGGASAILLDQAAGSLTWKMQENSELSLSVVGGRVSDNEPSKNVILGYMVNGRGDAYVALDFAPPTERSDSGIAKAQREKITVFGNEYVDREGILGELVVATFLLSETEGRYEDFLSEQQAAVNELASRSLDGLDIRMQVQPYERHITFGYSATLQYTPAGDPALATWALGLNPDTH